MAQPPQAPQAPQPDIQGDPLDLETLLDFAQIDPADIESAADWWDNHASAEWVGALDSEPITDER